MRIDEQVKMLCIKIPNQCCSWSYYGLEGGLTSHREIQSFVDYVNPKAINITNLPEFSKASEIGVKVHLDDKLVCYVRQSLDSEEVIK